jgi:hypothetical protein
VARRQVKGVAGLEDLLALAASEGEPAFDDISPVGQLEALASR